MPSLMLVPLAVLEELKQTDTQTNRRLGLCNMDVNRCDYTIKNEKWFSVAMQYRFLDFESYILS